MLLAIDIGNTNIVLAVHDGKKWIADWRIFSDWKKTSDEYALVIKNLFAHAGLAEGQIAQAVLCSVVPNLTRSFEKNIQNLFHIKPLVVSRLIETGLQKDTTPPEMGSDLLANAAWAHHTHPAETCMVVDFGTALTFTTVDGKGRVLGAAIAPGLVTAVNALVSGTAQLPQVQLSLPTTALGLDSEQSIRAGIMYGYAGLVKELVERTEAETGARLFVIATGGLSASIAPLVGRINRLDPMHTLEGLRLFASLNY
ncbi:MAG: type III pantothenate kinase [Treponema sp.]|jgi:type III pantothenate kinase|nr:type III pantothenate kinase [Treponema sp.]